jgi:8-oxo-dGTP pyrophosphatase MutT (NUDIX family)
MVPTTLVVLVVVPHPHDDRYLIVEERDGTFYLPAGRVEPGENLLAAAVRETAEEAGVGIGLRGLLGFDHEETPGRRKLRFAFVGYVAIDAPPKSRPDGHSRGAAWRTKAGLATLPLRAPEVLTWIARYESGGPLLPCSAYECFGAPSPGWNARLG